MSQPTDYLLLGLLWAVYCAVHSALISITVTAWSEKMLGTGYRFYRLLFNLFSLGTLVPLIMFSRSARWKSSLVLAWDGYWRFMQYGLIAVAVLLVVTGARHYSLQQFLGLQQIRDSRSRGAMTDSGGFDSTGVLGVVRHPWYVAVFILIWASDLNLAAITINVVLSVYLVVGTILEERKLVRQFGDQYRCYQSKVSMFIPYKWLSARLQAHD